MAYNFRTLNYLGSKLRLLDFIREQITRVTPSGGGVCDLFAGSGCVAYKLSESFSVTACDIQHYSSVICKAMLEPHTISEEMTFSFLEKIGNVDNHALTEAFMPLIETEERAIREKDLELLTDIVEHGSVEVFARDNTKSILSEVQKQVMEKLGKSSLSDTDSIISRYYGGVYFSYRQAVMIDLMLSEIRKIESSANRDVCLAALMSTASDLTCTVGKHFAQPIKARDSKGNIKSLVYNKAVKDKTIDAINLYKEWLGKYITLPRGCHTSTILQGDYMDCLDRLSQNVQTIYADPPYTRDHYSRFYHVLETMALGDAPDISTVTIHGESHISNGIYRSDRHQSPFCIRSQAPKAFHSMLKKIAEGGRNLLLSYSPYDETKKTHPRVVTVGQLTSWAKEYFDTVEMVSAGHFTHNKLNSTEHFLESSDEAELLIVCTNPRKNAYS